MAETAKNQLDALKSMSKVVADTGDLAKIKEFQPIDCTTNPSLVLKAVNMKEHEHYMADALKEEFADGKEAEGDRPYAGVVDRLIVNIGADVLDIVPGRVSTEVDASLSFDTDATVAKARRIIELYAAKGVGKERVYVKIASTWPGINAARILEKEGINCNLTLLFSFAQAVACAQAGATLISPFVGRILDWYKAKHNRDAYPAAEDPGVLSVQRIYNYYKKFDVPTIVMAASFRNVGEIRELAGVDNITVSPPLLEELRACGDPLPRRLDPASAPAKCDDEEVPEMDEALFEEMHGKDEMAVDKLQQGIDGFVADQRKLEELIAKAASA